MDSTFSTKNGTRSSDEIRAAYFVKSRAASTCEKELTMIFYV
jgi:hypothetical protein